MSLTKKAATAPGDGRLSPARPLNPDKWAYAHESSMRVKALTGTGSTVWHRGALRVLSSSETAEYRGLVVPHNHISVSVDPRFDRRPTDGEMDMVRRDFDMVDAEEDNHQPGRIRNLFLPLHLPRGTTGVCDCKADEEQVTEPDGFVWSRKRGPS